MSASTLRVPVGSLFVIAPPGANTAALRSQLAAAGLPDSRVVSRAGLRRKFGNECKSLACRAVPARCTHHEAAVETMVEAHAATFLAAGDTWLYDGPIPSRDQLVSYAAAAHQAGRAAVALRRVTCDGADLPVSDAVKNAAADTVRSTRAEILAEHAAYTALTDAELSTLGFDTVLHWTPDTRFELMPSTWDARGIDTSAFAVVGDLHGCASTFLDRMLPALGTDKDLSNPDVVIVSVGDVHDKGGDPQGSVALIRWWMAALRTGRALMVESNHSRKLVRHLIGHNVRVSPGLRETLDAIDAQPDAAELKAQIVAVFSQLPSHLVFDDLAVVHAGLTREYVGNSSAKARGFMLHVRNNRTPWEWTGTQTLVHGHDPVDKATVRRGASTGGVTPGKTINVDTGAYMGGQMTAYVHRTGSFVTVTPDPSEVSTRHLIEVEMEDFADVPQDVS